MKRPSEFLGKFLPKDPFFRLLLINGITGVGIAALVFAGIFWANIGKLRTLVVGAEDPFIPVVMLAAGLIITLVSVVTGSAIMLLGRKGTRSGGSGPGVRRLLETEVGLVPVRAESCRNVRRPI